MKKVAFSLCCWLLTGFCRPPVAYGAADASAAPLPKLVVVLVGDQVRADYFDRFHSDLAPDGLRLFQEHGAFYTHAAIDDAITKTSPGHVLIGSGLYPSSSGIINNEWYDRATRQMVSAAELALGGTGRVELHWFVGQSFADRLHRVYPLSRVISISLKDRGALLLTGPDQDDAYWFDPQRKAFVHYQLAVLPWLETFNKTWLHMREEYRQWDMLVPVSPASLKTYETMAQWTRGHHTQPLGLGLHFPHPIHAIDELMKTPYGDTITESLAEEAVKQWKLGHNPTGGPDVLTISFSEVDLAGHEFGPDSLEVRDAFLRLDRTVAQLIHFLNHQVGPQVVYAFTADHGVTPFPEVLQHQGQEAGRVAFTKKTLPHLELIEAVSEPYIYMNRAAVQQKGWSLTEAEHLLKKSISSMRGIDKVFTADEIQHKKASVGVQRAYYCPSDADCRSGDLYITLKKNFIFSDNGVGTTHGQPTPDDTRVPLAFYGQGVTTQIDSRFISPAIIAPTLLTLLKVPADGLLPPARVFSAASTQKDAVSSK